MAERYDLVLTGGRVVTPSGAVETDVAVRDGRIVGLGDFRTAAAAETLDCGGLTVLPGVIDSQVHFREPGLEHKEDLESGSRAAVLGGVTAVMEMPNTRPLTDSPETLADKLARARDRMWCDHAFFVGATPANADRLAELERLPGAAGVKIFMGSSTGDLLVADDGTLARVLASGHRRVSVHAEDEPRLVERRALVADGASVESHPDWRDRESAIRATKRLIATARATGRPVHVLHITTAEELELLAEARDIATVEVTPQHLTLAAPDCYRALGTHAQMNPPIRGAADRAALWDAIASGLVDVLGSDHAPHTAEEKARPYPDSPSGMPGVQTLVPLLLDRVNAGWLTLERLVDLTAAGQQRLFGITGKGRIVRGYDADFTIVDLSAEREITQDWLASKSGWSPFTGMRVKGWPIATVVRGHIVMRDGALTSSQARGRPIRFDATADPAA